MQKAFEVSKKMGLIFLALCLMIASAGCQDFDENYGTQSSALENVSDSADGIKVPEIMSDDAVMPNYFDISLYDEENYADIYLGKKFKFKATYAGSELEVPSTYKKMEQKGYTLLQDGEYGEESLVLAGKTLQVEFINEYANKLIAVFYNSGNSSKTLKKCPIVKFIIPENSAYNTETQYGQFWVNGINNESAITDIVEYLGAPSHFYAVSPSEYYLDYFIYEKDKRSGITVYVDPTNDSVKSIEFAYYK